MNTFKIHMHITVKCVTWLYVCLLYISTYIKVQIILYIYLFRLIYIYIYIYICIAIICIQILLRFDILLS